MSVAWSPPAESAGNAPAEHESFALAYLAVLGAWVCFGSFAVPMKWQSVTKAEVHPLVYQCYKTFWTFATSHLVLFFEPYEFTWWGILSGFSWVPAGVASVVAVQNIGIACGQAVWQVMIIVTSFIWGFAVFQDESVYTWYGTMISLLCLALGVVGMTLSFHMRALSGASDAAAREPREPLRHNSLSSVLVDAALSEDVQKPRASLACSSSQEIVSMSERPDPPARLVQSLTSVSPSPAPAGPSRTWFGYSRPSTNHVAATDACESACRQPSFALGLGAALFNGLWGGSNLVPSHYAPKAFGGVRFVISFATGALIANVTLVIGYIILAKLVWKCPLPSPQFRVMAIPGFLSGSTWSFGNFCSLYVVEKLHQGIGYSLIQSSVIVAGLWGILYYRELSGKPILYWMLFCGICLCGVFGLVLERKG